MRTPSFRFLRFRAGRAVAAGLLTLAIWGCVTSRAMRDGKDAEAREHWDIALLAYQNAFQTDPSNLEAKACYNRVRLRASRVHFERGKIYRQSGQYDLAALELEQAASLDASNDAVQQELKRARADIENRDREAAGGTATEQAKARSRGRRAAPPMLNPSSDKPIDVSFPPDTNIKKIYNALCASAGINVIFDPQLKDDKFTLDLRGMTFQRALEVAMRQAAHFYKILDERTIIIAQDTQQNRREYEDLVIRTFFLSNGDVKDVSGMVRAVLDMRRLQPLPQLNAIVIRDTADKVAVAERLIEVNDKAKSEVIIDVEILLIGRNNLLDLGVLLSQYSTTVGIVGSDGKPVGSMTWEQIKGLGINDLSFTLPTITFNFLKQNSDAQVLARPQLRISEGEKAQLVIGDRVPIPVSTYNTTQSVGGVGVVPITSFQYQDVGIKVEIEPRVHHNKEVSMKLLLEISNIAGYVKQTSGPDMPQIGTRSVNTSIRLKDGETNFLAGLVRRDQTQSKDKVAFLGDLPLIGPLFTHTKTQDQTTDIFMALTPHIIRSPQITEEDLIPIWVGTENNVSFSGGGTRLESPSASGSPFDGGAAPPRPQAPRSQSPSPFIQQGSGPSDLFRQPAPQQQQQQQQPPAPQTGPAAGPGMFPTPVPTPPPGTSSLASPAGSAGPASAVALASPAPVVSAAAVTVAERS
jgi:general secretion pathway protein D